MSNNGTGNVHKKVGRMGKCVGCIPYKRSTVWNKIYHCSFPLEHYSSVCVRFVTFETTSVARKQAKFYSVFKTPDLVNSHWFELKLKLENELLTLTVNNKISISLASK